MKRIAKELVLLLSFLLVCAIYAAPIVKASPDPLNTAWFITDSTGTPVDGAWITIYYSYLTPNGPFTIVPATIVEDKIPSPSIYRNPVITGEWNPDPTKHGIACVDIHLTAVSDWYFYAKIEYNGVVEYWPTANSYKPGDPSWMPIKSSGKDRSPSGWAAWGSGFGNGPTTGYPNNAPPPWPIPEVPFGTIVSFLSMFTMLVGFIGVRRFRQKTH